ncbi:uncharacterized protein LOC119667370 [Teleopsis dalmanni]|nr:uncharacterized protein LOC119667370 [Teleopsis dalmanni]
MIHLVMTKVDSETKRKWNECHDYTKLPTWLECCKMLDRRCQQLMVLAKAKPKATINQELQHTSVRKPFKHILMTKQKSTSQIHCVYCLKPGHYITNCPNFLALSIENRCQQAKQIQLCFNCLRKDHISTHCPSTYSCRMCKKRHHSLLHNTGASSNMEPLCEQTISPLSHVHTNALVPDETSARVKSVVLLATAMVLVKDASGTFQLCRVLLDSCSQVNLISESMCNALHLKKSRSENSLVGVGAASINIKHKTISTIRSRSNSFEAVLEFLVTKRISGYHPNETLSLEELQIPENLQLADPTFYKRQKIDMLLGAEAFFSLLAVGQIKLGENLPTLQKTLFGWIISGKHCSTKDSKIVSSHCVVSLDTINANLERLWQIEEPVHPPSVWSVEEQQCETNFQKTVALSNDGRIMTRLPFKGDTSTLGNSQKIALRRFLSMERRLDSNIELKLEYVKFMQDYENLGHMSMVKDLDLNSPHYFIPHHYVIKPDSTTTKLRVVFDASARTSSQGH